MTKLMTLHSHPLVYDTIGCGYRRRRNPDARIAERINRALGDAKMVCNVGAGTGSYEPNTREVTAVEPSRAMIAQRTSTDSVVCAVAEALPFPDDAFDAAMAVLSVHHWKNPVQGLAEMRRVSKRQVIFTFDPERRGDLWLVSAYIPEILEFDRHRALPIEKIVACLEAEHVESVPIPWDCTDGFQAAYWRRPSEYLDPEVQATISTLAQLPANVVARAMGQLSQDLANGDWSTRYAELLQRDEMDLGYQLIVADRTAV